MTDWYAWEEVEALTEQERRVLRVRFGYQHTLAETGELAVGRDGQSVTRARVRQIEESGLRKLRFAGYSVCLVPRETYRFTKPRPDDARECLWDD